MSVRNSPTPVLDFGNAPRNVATAHPKHQRLVEPSKAEAPRLTTLSRSRTRPAPFMYSSAYASDPRREGAPRLVGSVMATPYHGAHSAERRRSAPSAAKASNATV